MLVSRKRKSLSSAATQRVTPPAASFPDNTGSRFPLVRLSRPQRETAAVAVAGPIPPRAGANRALHRGNGAENEDSMLSATECGDRITVKCSCGCYSLTAHRPSDPRDGLVRCLICGARAALTDLLAECETRRNRGVDTE